jgi:hypothetical protein
MEENLEQSSSGPRFSLLLILLLVGLVGSLLAWWRLQWQPAQTRPWNAHLVEPGMTRDQVNEIMGMPHSSEFERWSYRIDHDDQRKVWLTREVIFDDGRVKEVRDGLEGYAHHERTRDYAR